MILLDTNAISEPLRAAPEPRVVGWIDAQPIGTLFLSSVTVAELRFGVAALPAGKRRDQLRERIEREVLPLFIGRVLAFDLAATQSYADALAKAKRAGFGIGQADGYIAAIALANGLTVATRDTQPFKAAGVAVIDPWVA